MILSRAPGTILTHVFGVRESDPAPDAVEVLGPEVPGQDEQHFIRLQLGLVRLESRRIRIRRRQIADFFHKFDDVVVFGLSSTFVAATVVVVVVVVAGVSFDGVLVFGFFVLVLLEGGRSALLLLRPEPNFSRVLEIFALKRVTMLINGN